MDAGLDTGPVALTERIAIGAGGDGGRTARQADGDRCSLMVVALEKLEAGTLELTPQPAEGVTYASKIDKSRNAHRLDFAGDRGP